MCLWVCEMWMCAYSVLWVPNIFSISESWILLLNFAFCFCIFHFPIRSFSNGYNKSIIYCIFSSWSISNMFFHCCWCRRLTNLVFSFSRYINFLLLIIAVVLLSRRLDLAIEIFAHTLDSVFSHALSIWLILKMFSRTCYNEMVVRLKIDEINLQIMFCQ